MCIENSEHCAGLVHGVRSGGHPCHSVVIISFLWHLTIQVTPLCHLNMTSSVIICLLMARKSSPGSATIFRLVQDMSLIDAHYILPPTILLFSNEYTQTTTQPPPGLNFYLLYPLTDWNSQCRRPQYLPLLPRLDDDKISRSPGWWCSPKIVCAVCRAARNDFYYYKHLWKWVNLNQIILNDHITNPCWEELLCHMFASYAAAINSHCD